MEFKLPYEIKRRLLSEILSLSNPFNLTDHYTIVDFLSEFLPLHDMPSEDARYINAYDDSVQHLVNNDDWDFEYIFNKRFDILADDSIFKLFIEKTINSSFGDNKNLLISLVRKNLKNYEFDIVKKFDKDSNVIYSIVEQNKSKNQSDFPLNNIPFYVVGRWSHISAKYPFFKLTTDNWDDFGYKTFFLLEFHSSESQFVGLGGIRIMKRGEYITIIDSEFLNLSKDYCSLFNTEESYFILKKAFPDRYVSILSALNDVGYFPSICESFENEEGFKISLCRDSNESEKIIRTVRHKLNYGNDVSNFFDFEFLFNPIYSDQNVSFNFDFDVSRALPKRLYCIIGKNGVGKTLMLKDLLLKLSEKNFERIFPKVPLFGKIIVVSYSYFDSFDDLKSSLDFNFLFCGLVDNETNLPLSNEDVIIKIINSINKIQEKELEKKYFWICQSFIDSDIINNVFSISANKLLKEDFKIEDIDSVNIRKENISGVVNKMSSGQKALFFIVTEIIANIRYNSFLIFDELETHLHPNAITEFMNVIIELLEEFDSYGLIATHSPLVVREIFSANIFVFEKDENIPRIRKLEIETFGENLSTITNEIFGNRDVSKYYMQSIQNLVNAGKSYEDIENLIQGDVPLNLNVKILIKSLVKNRDEESEEF